ncbi:MAG: PAS domain-containing protein [Actinobacteria bacterium]|nr:PAS domain-containing protein [Actinomycetota bacterium]
MATRWADAGEAYLETTDHSAALVELAGDDVIVRAVNRPLARLLGRARDEFVDQPGSRFYPPAELADVVAWVRDALTTEEPVGYEAVRELAQGRLVVVGRVIPLDGRRCLIVGSDISRQRAAEERLARLEALADIGLWAWNVVDEEVEWSDHYRRIHGLPREATPSVAAALEVIHPDDRARMTRIIAEVAGRGRTGPVRYRVVGADGEVRHMEGRAEVVRDAAGDIIRVVGTVQDVTEQQALEERERRVQEASRRQAHAMELNDDIVQELSRAWLALELEDVAAAREAIEATTRRVQNIVSGLLDATALAAGEVGPGALVRQRPAGGEPRPPAEPPTTPTAVRPRHGEPERAP